MRFEPGRLVVRRYFKLGETISVVKCARIVAEDERGLLLWIASGSPLRWLRAADGRGLHELAFPEWLALPKRLHRSSWQGPGILVLIPPAAAHTIWWFWRMDGQFAHWYVNLERPPVRWDDGAVAGLDTVDHDLDIVVAADRSWAWKDEQELIERSAYQDHYWVDDPTAVRAEGERVTKLVETAAFPFDGTWCDFRPDPGWLVPDDLPIGWDRPRAC